MTSAGWCLKKVIHAERIHIHLILLGKLSQFTYYEYLLLDFLFSVTIKRVFILRDMFKSIPRMICSQLFLANSLTFNFFTVCWHTRNFSLYKRLYVQIANLLFFKLIFAFLFLHWISPFSLFLFLINMLFKQWNTAFYFRVSICTIN